MPNPLITSQSGFDYSALAVEPVPEPPTWSLMALALVIWGTGRDGVCNKGPLERGQDQLSQALQSANREDRRAAFKFLDEAERMFGLAAF